MRKTALQPVRGTRDIMGDEMRYHRFIADSAREVASLYGFEEISTPIFEFSEVFHRTLGESSDVVSKETYCFEDRGGDSLTLRPELTASVVRAFINSGNVQNLPFRAFYSGPAFRYERPQKGRLRQFHQVGVEMLGANTPYDDIETIACAVQFLERIGLDRESGVTLEINSLGDAESRAAYRQALVDYLIRHENALSEESRVRLEVNPLRVLDSKQKQDIDIVENAPKLGDYFNDISRDWLNDVLAGLESLGIEYVINPHLVRGLDYYNHTVFEFTSDVLGSQNTVLAGGRYDGLSAMMGGPDVAGFGWAAGIERLSITMQEIASKSDGGGGSGAMPVDVPSPTVVIPFGKEAEALALKVAQSLRQSEIFTKVLMGNNIGKRLRKASKMRACRAIIIGEDELANNSVTVKDLSDGSQSNIALDDIVSHLVG